MIEWLEPLGYEAVRLKVGRSGFAIRRLENAVNPRINGYHFESGKH